ncbi:MAG: hypothetical protein AW07_00492 [Candidatus Accumulibacter sp. SK-11]|nr:MAG: hypothetical protein AW07_00492 [Candidatus Accumulibacter sp. SK-11]
MGSGNGLLAPTGASELRRDTIGPRGNQKSERSTGSPPGLFFPAAGARQRRAAKPALLRRPLRAAQQGQASQRRR